MTLALDITNSRLNFTKSWATEKKAFWMLMLLSPAIAEMMSGSCPPLEFFNPFCFLFLVGLYGCGVVLIRETAIKWNKGWGAILLMGAAYGIVEEGLAVKSWFDPGWMDLGYLGVYGRFMGTNTIWAVWLTLYHMVISIAVPIMLIDLFYPQLKGKRITDDKDYRNLVIIMFLDCILIFAALNPYIPPAGPYLLAAAATVLLVYMAYRLPTPLIGARPAGTPDWGPARFWLLGTFLMFWSFVMYAGGVYLIQVPVALIILNCIVAAGCLYLLLRHIGTERNERHIVAFVAGLLSWLIFLDMILWQVLLPPVGIAVIIGLVLLYRKVDLREKEAGRISIGTAPVPQGPVEGPVPLGVAT
jgi:hypothetical protein